MSGGRRLALVASAAMLAAVGAGLWINGSPVEQRERRIDQRRVEHLRLLDSAVGRFHGREGRLPESLAQLRDRLGADAPGTLVDPLDGRPYDYRPLDATRFELCATFSHAGGEEPQAYAARNQGRWRHPAGRHCFVLEVEADAAAATGD